MSTEDDAEDDEIRRLKENAFRHLTGLPELPPGTQPLGSWAPYTSEDEFGDDLDIADGLFDVVDETYTSVRVSPGSPDERAARDAAARIMYASASSRCGASCHAAAQHFLGDLSRLLRSGNSDQEFELVFRRRRGKPRGPAPSDARIQFIAHFLVNRIRKHRTADHDYVDAAVADAVSELGVSNAAAWDAWRREGKDLLDIRDLIDGRRPAGNSE